MSLLCPPSHRPLPTVPRTSRLRALPRCPRAQAPGSGRRLHFAHFDEYVKAKVTFEQISTVCKIFCIMEQRKLLLWRTVLNPRKWGLYPSFIYDKISSTLLIGEQHLKQGASVERSRFYTFRWGLWDLHLNHLADG